MVYLHEGKIIFDWKIHPVLKENEYYEEKCQNNLVWHAGENKTLENLCEMFKKIKVEFTSPVTPQQNGVVEGGFYTLYPRILMMMAHVGIHENFKTGICPECVVTMTKLINIMVKPHEEKCAHEIT